MLFQHVAIAGLAHIDAPRRLSTDEINARLKPTLDRLGIKVDVLPLGSQPPGCEKRGDVAVSVKDSIAFYERNDLRVRDELETLARNEAPGLGGDTVQPLDAYDDGTQRFTVWRCGG